MPDDLKPEETKPVTKVSRENEIGSGKFSKALGLKSKVEFTGSNRGVDMKAVEERTGMTQTDEKTVERAKEILEASEKLTQLKRAKQHDQPGQEMLEEARAAITAKMTETGAVLKPVKITLQQIAKGLKEPIDLPDPVTPLHYTLNNAFSTCLKALDGVAAGQADALDKAHGEVAAVEASDDKSSLAEKTKAEQSASKTLEQTLDKIVDSFAQAAAKVETGADNLLKNPKSKSMAMALQYAKADQHAKDQEGPFNKANAKALALIAELARWEHPDAPELENKRAKCARDAADNYETALAEMTEVIETAEREHKQHVNAYWQVANPILEKLRELEQGVNEFQTDKKGPYSKLNDKLRQNLERQVKIAQNLVGNGKNIDACKAAEPEIEYGLKLLADLKHPDLSKYLDDKFLGGKDKKGHQFAKFITALQTNLDKVKKGGLNDEECEKFQQELDGLTRDTEDMLPRDAEAAFFELQNRLVTNSDSLKKRWEDRKSWCEQVDKDLKQADSDLSKIGSIVKSLTKQQVKDEKKKGTEKDKLPTQLSDYQGSLRKDIEKIRNIYRDEPATTVAKVDALIRELQNTIRSYLAIDVKHASRQKPMVDKLLHDARTGQEAIDQRGKDIDKLRDTIKTALKDWDKEVPKAQREAYKDQYQDLIKQAKDARNLAKKDFESATSMWTMAKEGKDSLAKMPVQPGHKNFGRIDESWSNAAAGLNVALGDLAKRIRDAAEANGSDADKKQAKKAADAVLGAGKFFRATAFKKPAAVFRNKDATREELRRAREDVLKVTTLYMDHLTTSPLLLKAMRNPFGKASLLSGAHRTLRQIESDIIHAVD